MIRPIKALLDALLRRKRKTVVPVIRRPSVLFPDGRRRPSYCHPDRARHRDYHHYYEDLLS